MSGYGEFSLYYDGLTENVSYRDRAQYFHNLIQRHSERQGLLLDLACGTGSLSFALDDLGYDVIGVDGSAEMLSVAMQKQLEQEKHLLFLCQDMRELDLYGTIDAAVCALDSLNHLPDLTAVEQVLAKVSLFLSPGGVFVFDMNSVYKHREVLGDNVFVYDTDEVYAVWQNRYSEKDHGVEISLDFFVPCGAHYDRTTEQFREVAYEHEQIEAAIEKAGLVLLECLEGDTMNVPKNTTERCVYVTRKPVAE